MPLPCFFWLMMTCVKPHKLKGFLLPIQTRGISPPGNRIMTRIQEIIQILSGEALSLPELAGILRVHIKEIYADLPHIEKSIQRRGKLVITPAQCRKCGFIFKDHPKIKTPSRCPKCKGKWMKEAAFQIQEM